MDPSNGNKETRAMLAGLLLSIAEYLSVDGVEITEIHKSSVIISQGEGEEDWSKFEPTDYRRITIEVDIECDKRKEGSEDGEGR